MRRLQEDGGIKKTRNDGPDMAVVVALADRVALGHVVEADLTDGTFVALMSELKQRGLVLQPRAESDPVKWLKPFLFRVG
jgi:hypothetical protein